MGGGKPLMALRLAALVLVIPGIKYTVAAANKATNTHRVTVILGLLSCGKRIMPNRYNTIANPMAIQIPIKVSLSNIPHCFTRSAFDKNLIAMASSRKPNTTFTLVSQPPDLGKDCSQ